MADIAYYDSPIGILEITASRIGIREIRILEKAEGSDKPVPDTIKPCINQLEEYFSGKRKKFDLDLDLGSASEFYRDVWSMVMTIPYGKTRSYSAIAEVLERPKASRAVGQANGKNPIPIIIPCHRVIGKHGALRGYAYGLGVKHMLLSIESPEKYVFQGDLFVDEKELV
jgi:methylated-DNA-[protein]-cysteine S-methyltransferase